MNRTLGATGVQVSELALGTWQYCGGVDPLRTGIDLGATFIDTAESYGNEEVVGEAIRGIRDQIFLATKASPGHFRSRDLVLAAEASLKRLGTEWVDLYQLQVGGVRWNALCEGRPAGSCSTLGATWAYNRLPGVDGFVGGS